VRTLALSLADDLVETLAAWPRARVRALVWGLTGVGALVGLLL
jgi:hypothetical protein